MASPNSKLTVAVAQVHTQPTLAGTLSLLSKTTSKAAANGTSILLFPEAFLGGYPRTCSFGAVVGSRLPSGRDQFLAYYKAAVDLGDTPDGAGDAWLRFRLPVNPDTGYRGDGTREYLEDVAQKTGVFIVAGCVERAGGSLYCAAVFVDPKRGIVGKRRKVQPTGSERLVWSQGQPSSLKAVSTTIKGVKVVMGCAICWENYMPLLRYSLYAQGVNLWLAPTADPRATWEPLMKTVGCEGRCWVLSGNQCMRKRDLPEWITGTKTSTEIENESTSRQKAGSTDNSQLNGTTSPPPALTKTISRHESGTGRRLSMTARTEDNHEIAWPLKHGEESTETIPENPLEEAPFKTSHFTTTSPTKTSLDNQLTTDPEANTFVSRGGSLIVSPMGETVAGPIWEKDDEIIYTEIDFDDCVRGKLDFDASGHYARLDAFKLRVEGLELLPPP